MTVFLIIAAFVLCLYAALTDVQRLEIDNWVSVAIIGLFGLYGLDHNVVWFAHLFTMLVVFAIGFALNRGGIMGGGDVKLLTALALWAGLSGLPPLLMGTAMAGAVVALVTLGLQRTKLASPTGLAWIDGAQNGESHVAYGVAIACGAALMFMQIGV